MTCLSRRAPLMLIGAVGLCLVASAGCKGLHLRTVGSSEQEPDSSDPSTTKPDPVNSDVAKQANPKLPAALTLDVWRTLAPQPSMEPGAGYYWRHTGGLEALIAAPADEHPDFAALLENENGVLATNAAISLARLGDTRGRDRLVKSARDATLSLSLRCAAAEALAGFSDPPEISTLRELIDRFGQFDGETAYLPELHAQLLYGLARHVDAGSDERFTAALKSPAEIVRLAAVRGWLLPGTAELPARAADLRSDPDTRVRAATVEAMVARRHPQAFDAAQAALRDYRIEVRFAAIAALGRLGGQQSREALEKLEHEPEAIWAAAITALAAIDARDTVFAAADSPSWHVRKAAAGALARWPDDQSARLVRRLMTDPSLEVQKQLVAALADWPLPQAGPLLLDAMERGGYLPRKLAAAQLAERWPAAEEFSADAPPRRRAEMLASLVGAWGERQTAVPVEPAAPQTTAANGAISPERLAAAADWIARLHESPPDGPVAAEALRSLREFGPDLPDALAQLVAQRQTALPDVVYREVLPRFGDEFSELDRLTSADVQQRRRAAARLANQARRAPLSLLALTRLAEVGAREPDALVWSSMLRCVAGDGRDRAIRLAYAGLGHNSPEVRRLAIEHLAEHPAPEHARLLL
ncbi:MAG TPA: HEAT repeat domain-containing protein, partial [Pirellulales bacterium]|nr:HEAT repeat domain-containing protein [Pirellulales bacterium]